MFESLDSGIRYMGGVFGLLPLLCCFAMFAYLVVHLPENERSLFVWVSIVMDTLLGRPTLALLQTISFTWKQSKYG